MRCGFCLQTFSALEHQLFIEDDIQANEQLFNTIKPSNDSNERELEIPENLADTNEESAADQAIKNLPEESDENAIEENSHHTNRLFEEDNTKGEESETSLPAYEQTDSGNMEASDVVEEPGDGLYIDEVLKDEEIKVAEEIIEEQKEGEEEEKKTRISKYIRKCKC